MTFITKTKKIKTAAIISAVFVFVLLSCKKEKSLRVKFLDEYIIADSTVFQDQVIGGLSGINLVGDDLYFVVDDARNPRILKSKLTVKGGKIENIEFKKVISVGDTTHPFFKSNILDLEDLFFNMNNHFFYLVSEGSINYKVLPSFFSVDTLGSYKEHFELPNSFTKIDNFKHNGTFEGLSASVNSNGFWVATEAPLKVDGEEPTFTETQSPVRFTYFNSNSKSVTKQYAYQLDKIDKPAKGKTNLNGVTAILEFKENEFLVLERAYQSNYGAYGNTIKLYLAQKTDNTTNVLTIDALKTEEYKSLKKTLLLSFDSITDKLTDNIADNIEGITFGPKLPNGNKTILMVSDDNFQVYGKQLNQIILLELLN